MRSALLRVCCFLATMVAAHAQATLSAGTYTQTFDSIGTALPTGWAVWTSSTPTGNGAAFMWDTATIANNAAFSATTTFRNLPGASQTWSAGLSSGTDRGLGWRGDSAAARDGSITFTLTNTSGFSLTSLSFKAYTPNSSGSVATIQFQYQIGASGTFTNFSPTVSYTTVPTTSAPPLTITTITLSASDLAVINNNPNQITFRFDNTASTGTTWHTFAIDDFSLTAATLPLSITTQPISQHVAPGATATLTVVAGGANPLSYQWRKGGVAITSGNGAVSATTATLNLGVVSASDSGNYDVIVTDSSGSITSSVAVLDVSIAPATVTLSNLTATFDGTAHAATVTTSPVGLSTSVTYSGQGSAPTNAGTYPVIATITDPAYTGSATGNLVISPAAQTISFSTNPGFAPQVGMPFTVSASSNPGSTTVRFSIATGNGTNSGTNNATVTLTDTTAATIRATTIGDANNATVTTAPASTSPDLAVTAINPIAIASTYTQTFDSLGTTIPTGWHVFTTATATTLGTDVSGVPSSLVITGSSTVLDWGSGTGNFRNVASAIGASVSDSAATQLVSTNRALGVRQNASSDPGAAMAFNFSTIGVNVSAISFSAQIVSAQANATTWLLQWGVGATPTTWTTIATFNDPGAFGATTVSATPSNFGTALNNQSNVWLRVAALSATTFGGTRDTFAIDNFSIVTGPLVSVTAQPAALTRTSGQSATFAVSATGTGALSYQWRKGTTAIGGATSSTFTLPSALTTDAGNYTVVVTDTVGGVIVGTATSTAAALTVNPIATTIVFSNLIASYDGNPHAVTATPTPSAATIGAITYTGIGATPYSTSTNPPSAAGNYLVIVTVTDSEHQGTASNILVIGGAAGSVAPTVITAPVAQTASVGSVVTFSIEASGTPAPALQWRKGGVAIPGALSNTYTIASAALTDAGSYDVVIANPGGTILSPSASLTVAKKDQTITFAAPTGTVSTNTAVPLTATASSGLPVSFTIVSGAGSIVGSTLTGLGASVVVRASQAGNSTAFNAAENVDRTFAFVSGGTAPFLFSSPSDQTVSAGATVAFSAAAIGTPTPTWQWQKDGVAVAGATSANLVLTGVTIADAARYTVTATNTAGTASASATLTVRAAPAFTVSPASQNVSAGVNVTFAAAVTGSPTPALQWRKNGVGIPGAVSNTLTLVNVRPGDAARYDVVATSSLGSATSAAAVLLVTTRDFSGTYFGKFTGAAGDFALYVRRDGTGVFLGYLPGLKTGLAATNVTVDLAGNFSLSFPTLAATSGAQISSLRADAAPDPQTAAPPTAAAAQSVTLRGSLDDVTGTLTASVPELALTLDGTRAATTGSAAAQAGYYSAALVGSAAGRGYVIVAPDGQAFALAANGATLDGGKGTVANGRLTLLTAEQTTLDLGFANGAIAGSVTTAAGAVSSLSGANDVLAGTERLANISARGGVAPGAPLIAGFVVTGATPKQVLIRAAGPALAGAPFNVANALDDPALALFRGASVVEVNDNWSTPAASATAITTAGTSVNAFAFRAGSADAALLTTLAPGPYTVQVTAGAASRNGTGTALVEIYEILASGEIAGTRRLANLSARGPVVPGAPLIAGFVINGTAPQRVLIRGIGPALTAFNVPGALANPTLTLFRGATVLKTNDDWFRDADAALIRDAAAKSGAFALGASSLDASLLLYLEPGAYTAQVSASGATNGTGIALVEIYEVL